MLSDADAVWQPRRQHWGVRQRRKVPGATRIGAEMRWHGHRQYPPTPPGTLSDLNASRPLTNSGSWPRLCRWIMAMLQGGMKVGEALLLMLRLITQAWLAAHKPPAQRLIALRRESPERREGHQLLPRDRVQRPRVHDVHRLQPTHAHTQASRQASGRRHPFPKRKHPAQLPTAAPWRQHAPGSR